MGPLPYYLAFLTPWSVVLGSIHGDVWTFQTVLWTYVAIPIVDALAGLDRANLPETEAARRERSRAYMAPLVLYVPVQLGVTAWVLWLIGSGALTALETVGLTVSLGVSNGAIGITVAHELMHRSERWQRLLAKVLMMSVSYPHFSIEHVRGHHVRVATPADPASARLGEGFYRFWLRCVPGSVASAWRLEKERLARRGLAVWSGDNEMLRFAAVLAALYLALGGLGGAAVVLCFAAQGLIAFSLLEVINYIEHYGLMRREVAPGRYERVGARHSWNSNHRVTNWFLFHLPRHADHHLHPGRGYPALRDTDRTPELPAGYAAMFLVALVPPLWRRLMDPRARAWRDLAEAA